MSTPGPYDASTWTNVNVLNQCSHSCLFQSEGLSEEILFSRKKVILHIQSDWFIYIYKKIEKCK